MVASSIPSNAASTTSFGDARGVESLKNRAAKDPKAAVREAARQFESLFMQQLLKSMRESAQSGSTLDNDASKLGAEMLDTQWSTKLSGRPGGLGDMIAKQMERQMGVGGVASTAQATTRAGSLARSGGIATGGTGAPATAAAGAAASLPGSTGPVRLPQKAAADFVQQHQAAAQAAEAATGIPAAFMVAQAAHETGWGRKEILNADGSSANNLFGIKAGANWTGPTTDVMTTEFSNGQARRVIQKFRAYASAEESFADYARLMKNSPRYQNVVASGADAQGFAQGLQKAGYATDPAYADKLGRVINTTLRLQRSLQA